MSQTAYKFAAQVGAEGKLEVTVPVPAGTSVEVFVLTPATDEFAHLAAAAQSSLEFWDNPQDQSTEKMFAEMEPFTVRQTDADDSREAIYQRQVGE